MESIAMRKRHFLLPLFAAMFLAIGLGVVSGRDESDKDELTRLIEFQAMNRRLKEMTESMGPQAPEVVELRKKVELSRPLMRHLVREHPDTARSLYLSNLIRMLDTDGLSK